MISRLAATDGVSDDEAAAMGMFLLFAGHETTVAAIDEGALWLLAHPEQRTNLRRPVFGRMYPAMARALDEGGRRRCRGRRRGAAGAGRAAPSR